MKRRDDARSEAELRDSLVAEWKTAQKRRSKTVETIYNVDQILTTFSGNVGASGIVGEMDQTSNLLQVKEVAVK